VGLATFGPGCRTAEVLAPPTPTDTTTISERLQRFNPRGKGPLTLGLETAVATLKPDAASALVVLHDGLDNCGEDACAAVERFGKSHPLLHIYTVSFGVSAAEQRAISCLAQATGGAAIGVDNAAALDKALAVIADEVARLDTGRAPVAPDTSAAAEKEAPARREGPPRLELEAVLAEGKARVTVPVVMRLPEVIADQSTPSLAIESPPLRLHVKANVGMIEAVRDIEVAAEGTTQTTVSLEAGLVRLDTAVKKLASEAEEPVLQLYRTSGPHGSAAAPLWIARGKAIEALLPPGQYKARAEYGLARAEADITVAAGSEISTPLNVAAGRLELSAPGLPADAPITFSISVDDPKEPGGRRELGTSAYQSPAFVLPTGAYYVTARAAGSVQRRLVAVRDGEVTREALPFASGTLTVNATLNGSPSADRIEPLAFLRNVGGVQSSDGLGLALERPAPLALDRPAPLVPGRYAVTVRSMDGSLAATQQVEILAGKQRQVSIDLRSADLIVNLTQPDQSVALARCEVRNRTGEVVARSIASVPRFMLDPGDYVLACASPAGNRVARVHLAAGNPTTVAPFSSSTP